MSKVVRKLHPLFGAEIDGVPIKGEIAESDSASLLDHIATYGVVLLRGQSPSQQEFLSFAKSLGPIWDFSSAYKGEGGPADGRDPRVFDITNRGANGKPLPSDHPTVSHLKVNDLWHTDSTYVRPGAVLSLLAGHQVPPTGGNTDFCDTRIAYESLYPDTQKRIGGLVAFHSLRYSMAKTGNQKTQNFDLGAVRHPLVRFHEASGRQALCLASHIGAIDGLSDADCEILLSELMAVATSPDHVYSHQWQRGDVVIWDNYATMHRATPYEAEKYVRSMWSIRIADLSGS